MKERTKYQILTNNGEPSFVVIPFSEYMEKFSCYEFEKNSSGNEKDNFYVPQDVVEMVYLNGFGPLKAWRKFKQLTQKELAIRIGITQPSYNQMENTDFFKLTKKTQKKIIEGLQIELDHLDV